MRSSSSAAASSNAARFQTERRQLGGQHRVRLLRLALGRQLGEDKKASIAVEELNLLHRPVTVRLRFTNPLLSAKVFHGQLELPLLLPGLSDSRLVLLLIGHGHDSQDEVDQVEGAQEDDQNEENHVGLPC